MTLSGGQPTPARVSVDVALDGQPGTPPTYFLSTCCPWQSWEGCGTTRHPDGSATLTFDVTGGTLYYASVVRQVDLGLFGIVSEAGPPQCWGTACPKPLPEPGTVLCLPLCVILLVALTWLWRPL